MSPTTRATKKQAKDKQRLNAPAASAGIVGPVGVGVEHAGQEHTDEFLKEIIRCAPWDVWANKLALRKKPLPLNRLLPDAGESPLIWSIGDDTPAATVQILEWLFRLRRRRDRRESPSDWSIVAEEWLESLETRPVRVDVALEAIAWSHGLSRLAIRLPASIWAALVARLVNLAAESVGHESLDDASGQQLLQSQLISGELPMTLAYVFPKVECCRQLAVPGQAAIAEGLLASLDGEGVPHARLLANWRRLLACWTRCFHLQRQLRGRSMPAEARLQFEWLVRQSLRFRRADGTLILSGDQAPLDRHSGLIKSALAVGGDSVDHEILAVQRGQIRPAQTTFEFPLSGEHSEWAELSLLRGNWSSDSAYLGLRYPAATFDSEFARGARRIWMGPLLPDLRADGTGLEVIGQWEELCWSSDEDVDYLELEVELSQGWRLQRQFLLARQDHFLFLADVVLGPRHRQLDYRLELPLDPRLSLRRDDQMSEVLLEDDRPLAWVLPLALAEWRSDSRFGRFDGRVLYQSASAAGLYAPLFIDFSPKRLGKPRTWRQLTVAEDLRLIPRDVAAAYRVQVGSKQWVIYRSLEITGNRTFLGQNLTSEFLVGRFDSDGDLDTLIEIE
jgi:hypothetical protein